MPGDFDEGPRNFIPDKARDPIKKMGTSEINTPEIELLNGLNNINYENLPIDLNELFVVNIVSSWMANCRKKRLRKHLNKPLVLELRAF